MGRPRLPDAIRRWVMGTRAYLRMRDLALRAHRDNVWVTREDLARRHLFGEGIEMGALTSPLRVPPDVTVRHVDYKSRADLLRDEGPTLSALGVDPRAIPEIDVVDDAGTLSAFDDDELDFVIANHVLEHVEDPISALHNFLRVLRPDGILFLTLPDARRTFDAPRARTSVEHVVRDHREGPEISRRDHYEEWARHIEGVPAEKIAERAAEFAREDARHHFHVWELESFLALLLSLALPYELAEARAYGIEFAVVLRKSRSPRQADVHTTVLDAAASDRPPSFTSLR
jgi:predicted SAM-dependent methyltransferase